MESLGLQTIGAGYTNNIVITPDVVYGTYTATSGDASITDILPAEGEKDVIYRVGSWDGTQVNASKSSEYAWDGEHYVMLRVVDTIGEVFDISVYNASGGTPAQFADLAAALGSNGINVPTNVRAGGMQVRFIQSHDNNYVQYFLKKNEWSANEADWEKINLEKEVSQLRIEVGNKTTTPIRVDFVPSSWVATMGIDFATGSVVGINSGSASSSVDVSSYTGQELHYTRLKATSAVYNYFAAVAFYDTNGDLISAERCLSSQETSGIVDSSIIIPANASTARFTMFTDDLLNFYAYVNAVSYSYTSGLGKRVQDNEEEIADVSNLAKEVYVVDYTDSNVFTDGRFINTSGNLSSDGQTGYSYTDFLPIPLKKDIKLHKCKSANQYVNLISFYRDNIQSTYISGLSAVTQSGVSDYTVSASAIPENAKYMRITGNAVAENPQVEYAVLVKEMLAEIVQDVNDIDGKIISMSNAIDTHLEIANLNDTEFTDGSYIDTNGIERTAQNYTCTDFLYIPVKKDIKLYQCQTRNQYVNLISFYKSNNEKSYISGLSVVDVPSGTYNYTVTASQIPAGTKYIRVSGRSAENNPHIEYSAYLDEYCYENFGKIESSILFDFKAFSGNATLSASDVISLLPVKIKKNTVLSAFINGTIQSVETGVGYTDSSTFDYRTYDAKWIELTPTQVKLYGYYNVDPVLEETYSHGLTLTEKTNVSIVTLYDESDNTIKTKVVVSTDSGSAWEQSVNWGQGTAFVKNNNSNGSLEVKLSFMPSDVLKKVWVFGDSYFDFWPPHVYNLGLYKWLRNSQPGLSPSSAYTDLQNLLSLGYKPTYLVWCLGMNGGGDSIVNNEYVIDGGQKTVIDNIISLCTEKNIIPVFTTIPTVPTRQKTGYNTYIKSLGVRYIDMSYAVGADEYGIWHGNPTLRAWTNNDVTIYTQIYGDGHAFIAVGDNTFDVNGDKLEYAVSSVGDSNTSITVNGISYNRDSSKDKSGLMATDGVHPSVLGGKVLGYRVISDFPEIGIDE